MSFFQYDDIDMGAGNVQIGTIASVDYRNLRATVSDLSSVRGRQIDIHYHCEKTDIVDDRKPFEQTYPNDMDLLGASAFSVGDSVRVMFRGANYTKPLIVGFAEDPKMCFGYVVATIGDYCLVWHIAKEMLADDVPLNSDPEVMAKFPILRDDITDWINSREEVIFDTLFSAEGDPGDWGDLVFTEEVDSYDNSAPCDPNNPHGQYFYDRGDTTVRSWVGSEIGIFDLMNIYTKNETDIGKYYTDCVVPPGGDKYYENTLEFTLESIQNQGFRLTALNGSEEELDYIAVGTVNHSFYEHEHYHIEESGYDEWDYVSNYLKNVSKEGSYFSLTSGSQNIVGEAHGTVGGIKNPVVWDPYEPAFPMDILISVAAHYFKDYGAIVQLFVYKDDDDEYHGYGQADMGLGDIAVPPTKLLEQIDLSSALEDLAVVADNYSITANYYI